MNAVLQEALAECLARLEAGADIEDCLRDSGSRAAELRPLLEAAAALRDERGRIPEHTSQAFQGGRTRMHTARARQAEGAGGKPWAGLFGRPAALLAVAAVVAVVAALGLTTDMFRFGADTTSAHVEGVVSSVGPDAIVLITADGEVVIRIGENTIVLDADGYLISGGDIVPGRPARVEVEKDDDGAFAGLLIEIEHDDDDEADGAEVEFSGVIETVDGGTITMRASFGLATVRLDARTEIKGTLAPGLAVKVHASLEADGSYLAREIEVQAPGDEEGGVDDGDGGDDVDSDDDRPDNSGPGSTSSGPSGSDDDDGSDSSGPGSGDDGLDDEEDEEED